MTEQRWKCDKCGKEWHVKRVEIKKDDAPEHGLMLPEHLREISAEEFFNLDPQPRPFAVVMGCDCIETYNPFAYDQDGKRIL